jgi:signal transduction histidine kinase
MSNRAEILVVDDTPTNLEVAIETLSAAGYEVAAVTSGQRALKRLNSYLPDLILLDVQMPGIDGFETCHQIKKNPATAAVPVIFMTALSDVDNKVKGFDLGAVDYITKPFQERELLVRVRNHLQLRQCNVVLERIIADRTRELQATLDRLQAYQLQLVQSEKMSALGNLVAGVAHEINNPTSFLRGNIEPAQEYVRDLLALIDLYQKKMPEPDAELAEEIEAIDLEFIRKDLPALIASMAVGVERIGNISNSLRTFSRTDRDCQTSFNLHEGIESSLLILKHRTKANENRPALEITKDYGNIPEIQCFPGQLNQVFMNILANAIDALDEASHSYSFAELENKSLQISIKTEQKLDKIFIHIADNGKGMNTAVKARVFEQGFTTKEVGKGTGLGLAIAKQIIEKKHGGEIVCHSELGKGTEFILSLPLK